MKRIIALILAFLLVFSLVSCKLTNLPKEENTVTFEKIEITESPVPVITAVPTEEPIPVPTPTVLYINDANVEEWIPDIGDIKKGHGFESKILIEEYAKEYADYWFYYTFALYKDRKITDEEIISEERRLKDLGYNIWREEGSKLFHGIASQEQLKNFPYDLENFGYWIELDTNEPLDPEKYNGI